MALPPILPKPTAALSGARGLASTEWYEFFRLLREFAGDNVDVQEQISAMEERITALEEAGDGVPDFRGPASVRVTVSESLVQFFLDGDELDPGNTYYYGTGPDGVKGFFTVASALTANQPGIELVTGADGVTDIRPDDDLEAVEGLTGTGFAARVADNDWEVRTWQNGPGVDITHPGGVAGNPYGTWNSATAPIPALGGATYTTAQKLFDTLFSPGIITGGVVTALTTTSVRITACTALLRIADDNVSELRMCNVAQADFAVPDVQVTHFYAVDYNGGSPIYVQATTDTWDRDTQIPVGSAFRLDGDLNVTPNPYRVGDVITNLIQRADALGPVLRDASVGGLIISSSGTNVANLSAGRLWARVSDFTVPSKVSTADTLFTAYYNGVDLTITGGHTTWDNLNYNSGGALVALGLNKYANIWFFLSFDGTKWGYAYGTNEYNTAAGAQAETVPFYLTQNFFNQALLLGRFIFQRGASSPAIVETVFSNVFTSSVINDHNSLDGLQGGSSTERYHLTAAQQTAITAAGTNAQFFRGDKVYSDTLFGILMLIGDGAGTGGLDMTRYSGDAAPAAFRSFKARGSLAVPGAVVNGDALFFAQGRGYFTGGTPGFSGNVGAIEVRATEGFTNTAQGTRVAISTTPVGSTTRADRLFINDVSINSATDNAMTSGTASLRWSAVHAVNMNRSGAMFETGEVSANITGNTDNLVVSGIGTAGVLKLTATGAFNLTGIAGLAAGQRLLIINTDSADNVTLVHDATSTAANRFLCPNSANLVLNPNDSVGAWYDSAASRLRIIGV